MTKFTNPLDHVKIAAPCSADWNQMFSFEGERVRFCSQCNLNVYNLSNMTRSEAEALLNSTEGRLCVRFYRRQDGTILTQNCPRGVRAIQRRVAWVAQVVLGMVLSLLANVGLNKLTTGRNLPDSESPDPHQLQTYEVVMGDIGQTIEQSTKPKFPPGTTTRRAEQGNIMTRKRATIDQRHK